MGSKLRAKFDQICRDHPFKALNDVVYEVLMEEIILFRLRPGAKITESRIAEELPAAGWSRRQWTPFRPTS